MVYESIKGKRVLVTGGSRGIGKAIVKALCENGCRVVFLYEKNREAAKATEELTGAEALQCDISSSHKVKDAVGAAAEKLGGIDVLVNNAGISKIGLLTDMTDEEWSRILGVNLTGSFSVTREAARYMISEQFGRIINIGSMWGKTGASCEAAYSATKAGLRGFTMALAKELGPSNITVNCIEPGVIDTEMNACLDSETLEGLKNDTPLCRIGRPEDVANAVLFLASEEASFITGQIIGVDGGYAV